jgi:hypothetical protein
MAQNNKKRAMTMSDGSAQNEDRRQSLLHRNLMEKLHDWAKNAKRAIPTPELNHFRGVTLEEGEPQFCSKEFIEALCNALDTVANLAIFDAALISSGNGRSHIERLTYEALRLACNEELFTSKEDWRSFFHFARDALKDAKEAMAEWHELCKLEEQRIKFGNFMKILATRPYIVQYNNSAHPWAFALKNFSVAGIAEIFPRGEAVTAQLLLNGGVRLYQRYELREAHDLAASVSQCLHRFIL